MVVYTAEFQPLHTLVQISGQFSSHLDLYLAAFATQHFDFFGFCHNPQAVVLVAPESLPADGSVIPKAAILVPAAKSGRYFIFCSSVPNFQIGQEPSEV
jgi:hypothetical protein